MKPLKHLPAIAVAALLAASLIGVFLTRDKGAPRIVSKPAAGSESSLVDGRILETARRMAATADTVEEQDLAREALRLADHELDQAFATAMREAAEAKLPQTGPLQQMAAAVAQSKARVAADQERVTKLTADAQTNANAADQLELAKAQMALDADELDDAQQNLARSGGDRRARIQRELQAHEEVQKQAVTLPKIAGPMGGTLKDQAQAWFGLRQKERQIAAARAQAEGYVTLLDYEHGMLEMVDQPAAPSAGGEADVSDTAAVVDRLRRLSDLAKTLAELNKRGDDAQHLAGVYRSWGEIAAGRRRGAQHAMLGSLAAIFGVILAAVLAIFGLRRAFGSPADRRRLHQLRVMAAIAVELAAAAVILLILFGPPTQLTTMIGLLTAGMTVVLKDFIVAFFGWFTLMGRNGIRVGDWVEIEGVGGEVVEIGMLRTVLLEMGSLAGRPTGRRVAFVNSFAIERHFFNFSTAGQWLWDELQATLPASVDPYAAAQKIREAVERETAEDAVHAEREWERVTSQYGTRPFSAKPVVNLRPSGAGLEADVRYITRAPRRFEVKSRLLQAIVELIRRPEEAVKTPSGTSTAGGT